MTHTYAKVRMLESSNTYKLKIPTPNSNTPWAILEYMLTGSVQKAKDYAERMQKTPMRKGGKLK